MMRGTPSRNWTSLAADDYRTLNGTGVLLARYHLYDDAIEHFRSAMQANPNSDEVKFNLANAYFQKHQYPQALEIADQITEAGRKDDAYLTLMGDIYAHLGDNARRRRKFSAMQLPEILITIRIIFHSH